MRSLAQSRGLADASASAPTVSTAGGRHEDCHHQRVDRHAVTVLEGLRPL